MSSLPVFKESVLAKFGVNDGLILKESLSWLQPRLFWVQILTLILNRSSLSTIGSSWLLRVSSLGAFDLNQGTLVPHIAVNRWLVEARSAGNRLDRNQVVPGRSHTSLWLRHFSRAFASFSTASALTVPTDTVGRVAITGESTFTASTVAHSRQISEWCRSLSIFTWNSSHHWLLFSLLLLIFLLQEWLLQIEPSQFLLDANLVARQIKHVLSLLLIWGRTFVVWSGGSLRFVTDWFG